MKRKKINICDISVDPNYPLVWVPLIHNYYEVPFHMICNYGHIMRSSCDNLDHIYVNSMTSNLNSVVRITTSREVSLRMNRNLYVHSAGQGKSKSITPNTKVRPTISLSRAMWFSFFKPGSYSLSLEKSNKTKEEVIALHHYLLEWSGGEFGIETAIEIDHIDGDPRNNRLDNLRAVLRRHNNDMIKSKLQGKSDEDARSIMFDKRYRTKEHTSKRIEYSTLDPFLKDKNG